MTFTIFSGSWVTLVCITAYLLKKGYRLKGRILAGVSLLFGLLTFMSIGG